MSEPPLIFETGLMIKRLQARHHRAADQALAELGVSLVQWDALRHLSEKPGASLHDLAVLTFQTDQSMGTLAGRIQSRGLIERVPAPGRAVRHRLTPEGERIRESGARVLHRVLTRSLAPLSPTELAVFDGLLRRLLAADGSGARRGRRERTSDSDPRLTSASRPTRSSGAPASSSPAARSCALSEAVDQDAATPGTYAPGRDQRAARTA